MAKPTGVLSGSHGAASPENSGTCVAATMEPIGLNLQQYLNSIPRIRLVIDIEGKIRLINPAGCKALGGAQPEEVIGLNWVDQCVPAEQRAEVSALLDQVRNGTVDASHEHRILAGPANGRTEGIQWSLVALTDFDDHVVGIVCSGEEVGFHVGAEEVVKEHEERLRTLLESSIDAIMLLEEGNFIDCNAATLAMFGCASCDEFPSNNLADLSPPNQPSGEGSETLAQRYMKTAMETGSVNFPWVHKRLDGQIFHTEVLLSRMNMRGRQVLQAVIRDVSDRIKHEEEHARTVSQYIAMIDTVPAQTFLKDVDGRYILANAAFCKSVNKLLSEIIGKTDFDLAERHRVIAQHELENQVMEDNRTISKQDSRSVDLDGHETWTSMTTVPLHDRHGSVTGVVGLVQDVTELHQSREQLVQADKMAAIGTLSAGVAHEINNPVGFISSNLNTMAKYVEKIRRYADKDPNPDAEARQALIEMLDDFADAIEESKEGADRVRKIVADLKSFSRIDKSQTEFFNLNDGLETTLNIVWNELKYKCTVEKNYGEIPNLYCIPNQLNQVFMNLLVNAGHAIKEDSGTITITTSADKENVYVSIRDTGMGIPRENLKRIFEPFFTTKDVGKGTGLGLSMAYDIVQKHLGRISIKSTIGSGTEFIITLPLEGLKSSEAQNPDS